MKGKRKGKGKGKDAMGKKGKDTYNNQKNWIWPDNKHEYNRYQDYGKKGKASKGKDQKGKNNYKGDYRSEKGQRPREGPDRQGRRQGRGQRGLPQLR